MNNPIGRMPNPMAVPPIPPMGVNPTAQNPSAMAMPVVTQPKVDMQMMGTSPEKRKKFNDLLESLSAPRQESEDLPNVQGLHYGGMAGGFGMPMMPPMMSPYMRMGGFGGMGGFGMFGSPFAYNATQPLNSGNPFGEKGFGTSMNEPLNVFTTDMKPIPRIPGAGMSKAAVIDPNSPEEIEKRNKLMDYLSSVGTFPMNDFQPFQGLQGYETGGNVNIPMGRRNLLPQDTPGTKREMMKRDYASQAFRNAMDMQMLDKMMGGLNPRTAEASPQRTPTMGNTISNADMSGIMAIIEILKKGLPSGQGFSSVINRVINKEDGGEVQYLKGGGPTNPISKTNIIPSVKKEKDFNKDTTIPDFFTKTLPGVFSNVKDFLDTPVVELFTGPGPGPEINQNIKKISGPQGPAGLLPQAIDANQQVNFDAPTKFSDSRPSPFLTFDEQIDDLRYPKILNTYANIEDPSEILYSPFKEDQKSYIGPGYASPFSEEKPSYTIQPMDIIDVSKLDTDVLDMKAPMDVAPPLPPKRGGAGLNPNTLYDFDAFDIGTGTPKIADPFNVGSMGEFDTSPAGLDPFERARRERPPLSSMVDQAFKKVKSDDSTSGDSKSVDTVAATTDNVTNQQGGLLSGGIGSLLPLIVGMINPTAGMALGIMQAMGGQGQGQGQGIFGNLFSSGKKETNPLYDFDTFDIGTGTDQRNIIEKFLGLKAGTITPGEAPPIGDVSPNTVQETIEKIAEPTVPDPVLGEDGTYSCPLPYVYDPNTKVCVLMESGLGGQGAAANETKAPAGMQMGGPVDPNLNMAVDNFIQALA